ncbi:MAG: ATP-binding cassette domain-containing protein [Burkholderiales bacterium]|nr:ATP-binding cassette domain-containing protein [Burkholderiales bacterium]
MSSGLLSVERLSHRYTSGRRIEFGSFSLAAGEVLLLRGASGSGKSTLLNLLAGVLPVGRDQGLVTLGSAALHAMSAAQRDRLRPFTVGWMPQRLCLIQSLTVHENVVLPVALGAKSDALPAAMRRADALFGALGVADLAARRPSDISVGQAARVSLARALIGQPVVLLADEPTAALDSESAARVAQAITAYAAAGGAALIASHDEALAQHMDALRPANPVRQITLRQDEASDREQS